jgi:lipoate-protein ligase A
VTDFRLLVEDRQAGAWNMAVDQALLEDMGRTDSRPVVRLYGFDPPTLSLGRFQNVADVLDIEAVRRDGLCLVRRPTGGQAVLHDGELTYSVCLGRKHREPFSKREVYRFIAQLLVDALGRAGLAVEVAAKQRGETHDPDCFRTTGEHEIGVGGRKLVGSAQTLSRSGALQHGSIVLDTSNRRIEAYLRSEDPGASRSTCVAELLGRPVSFAPFRDELARHLEAILGARREELSAAERKTAARLARTRYGSASWTYDGQG